MSEKNGRWKSIAEGRLPKDDETVVMMHEDEQCCAIVGYFDSSNKRFYSITSHDSLPILITHWCELPEK